MNILGSLSNNITNSINTNKEINMKVLLLGLDSCGKTTIYKKLIKNDSYYDYITTNPTQEINSNNIEYKTLI
jgi:GTPase SAR1 family protein